VRVNGYDVAASPSLHRTESTRPGDETLTPLQRTYDMKAEVAVWVSKHAHLYDEVSQYHNDFLYLKLPLKALEIRVDINMSLKIRR